jgi:hypothetical protein
VGDVTALIFFWLKRKNHANVNSLRLLLQLSAKPAKTQLKEL